MPGTPWESSPLPLHANDRCRDRSSMNTWVLRAAHPRLASKRVQEDSHHDKKDGREDGNLQPGSAVVCRPPGFPCRPAFVELPLSGCCKCWCAWWRCSSGDVDGHVPLTHEGFGEGWAGMAEDSEKREPSVYPIACRLTRLFLLSLRDAPPRISGSAAEEIGWRVRSELTERLPPRRACPTLQVRLVRPRRGGGRVVDARFRTVLHERFLDRYQSSFTPTRAMRGGVIADGRRNDAPEFVAKACAGFALKML